MLSGQLHSNRGQLKMALFFYREEPILHNYTNSTHPALADLFFPLFLLVFGLFLAARLGVLVFIVTGTDMGGVDKQLIGGPKFMPKCCFQDALEDAFRQVCAPKTADIVFPESGEM